MKQGGALFDSKGGEHGLPYIRPDKKFIKHPI